MLIGGVILRGLATGLQWLADGLLWLAGVLTTCARIVLRGSRRCLAWAREWNPRLWARGADAGSDDRRRP